MEVPANKTILRIETWHGLTLAALFAAGWTSKVLDPTAILIGGVFMGRLADRLQERYPGERVWLVYKGSGVPSYYGIDAADPREVAPRQVHGLLVVSDTAIDKARGRLRTLIDTSRPIDEVGHSITIYRR